ncbi:MAG: CapA family protein, partial [Chloroflexi bacterium]|nr:CapA family protein [Chloroflexota bacterium]
MASAAETSTLTLMAGGDVGPVIEPTEQFSQLIRPTFQQADIRVVQCERTYSELGAYQRWTGGPSGSHVRLHPRMASTFKELGADVASLASNHAMDYGPDPLVDTVDLFRSMGLKTIGAGRNEEEARQPAIVERNGVKVAILGYCSILREGQAATPDKPGVAPMRAHTFYEREDFQPGTPAKILTIPYEDDLAALQEDVRRAKRQANAVAIFIHWGVRFLPKVIASYQPQVAHAAIDAGADIIIGHHAHIVKATEVYKGKVCF